MSNPVRVTLLGATGSIGRSTLDVVAEGRRQDADAFEIVAVTAQSNVGELARIARGARAQAACIGDPSLFRDLLDALSGTGIEAMAGPEAIAECGARPADRVVSAIVGIAGLPATLAAVRNGSDVALANKESMVCAGPLLSAEARRSGARILPVDSEHNAIFQVLDGRGEVDRLVLTASGGPFRTATRTEMAAADPRRALAHPNWSMGAKISIDSATMMNKGLELIEAVYLFDTPENRIDIVVHPQSIIHSLVSYRDGSTLAQMSLPDMRVPISYALAWPRRMTLPGCERLDLAKIGRLDFEAPDTGRFPALGLARAAAAAGGGNPVVLNAANEVAVASFLEGRLGFLDICGLVERVLNEMNAGHLSAPTSFDDVFAIDRAARERALHHAATWA